MEPSPNRGSDKINMLKKGRKTAKENKSYRTAWTHIWIPALREVDLEPSAKRGANRTKALVSLYWSSRSLHPKEPPNRIWHKSTKVDPIRSFRTWKKSYQISVLCHITKLYIFLSCCKEAEFWFIFITALVYSLVHVFKSKKSFSMCL